MTNHVRIGFSSELPTIAGSRVGFESDGEFLADLHRTLNSPSSKIRNRLLRLTADSPDLLAVIKAEGRV